MVTSLRLRQVPGWAQWSQTVARIGGEGRGEDLEETAASAAEVLRRRLGAEAGGGQGSCGRLSAAPWFAPRTGVTAWRAVVHSAPTAQKVSMSEEAERQEGGRNDIG